MQLLSRLVFTFLCSLSFLSPVFSIHCNNTQYAWPVDRPKLCCNMCLPGEHMVRRSSSICEIVCRPCIGDRYSDTYNREMSCEVCENCNKPNMEYSSPCTTTHNAVCRCKADYRCKDDSCRQCVPIPSTTTKSTLPPSTLPPSTLPPSTLPPSTTVLKPGALTTLWTPTQPIRDAVWFLVIISLLCAGITLAAVAKIKPFMRWVKAKHGYILAKDPQPVPQCSEDEEVSTPVQEVLGKCEV
ncbi:CD27 antigen [Anarrhichthys ocellatus]|uniref:CD27 antigen n=1 Tax=Anarrhichthys ocellatus TaxID=433405 RepID=UPI0012EE850D|nr:CD27 antigen [Anarrhichthys ocellatus]XP_031708689.1 CD27 antigen [Anarrhichthys ocellatus]